jgi:hypothetical protein
VGSASWVVPARSYAIFQDTNTTGPVFTVPLTESSVSENLNAGKPINQQNQLFLLSNANGTFLSPSSSGAGVNNGSVAGGLDLVNVSLPGDTGNQFTPPAGAMTFEIKGVSGTYDPTVNDGQVTFNFNLIDGPYSIPKGGALVRARITFYDSSNTLLAQQTYGAAYVDTKNYYNHYANSVAFYNADNFSGVPYGDSASPAPNPSYVVSLDPKNNGGLVTKPPLSLKDATIRVEIWLQSPDVGKSPVALRVNAADDQLQQSFLIIPYKQLSYTATPVSGGLGAAPNQISGTVYVDVQANGTYNATDPGVAGRTVYLDVNNNGQLDPGEPSTLTSSTGAYALSLPSSLPPGDYSLREDVIMGKGVIQSEPFIGDSTSILTVGLQNAVLSTDTTLVLNTNTLPDGFPTASGFLVKVGEELMQVTAVAHQDPTDPSSPIVLTVERGLFGTPVAASIPTTATVMLLPNAAYTVSLPTAGILGQDFGELPYNTVWEPGFFTTLYQDQANTQFTDPNAAFVAGLYQNILGRRATLTEINGWVGKMENATKPMSQAAVVAAIMKLPERLGLQVDGYFHTYFNRDPDPRTRASWIRQLERGVPEYVLVSHILASPEYRRAHPTVDSFVKGLFSDTSAQAPDAAGMALWKNLYLRLLRVPGMSDGEARRIVALRFLQSEDSRLRAINSFFIAFLHRLPTSTETGNALTLFKKGRSYAAVAASVFAANNDEYFQNAVNSLS